MARTTRRRPVAFDAVPVLLSPEGANLLADEATARFRQRCLRLSAAAKRLLGKAGVLPDEGNFAQPCAELRFWDREARVKRL